jgi:acyl dehydratase
VSEDGPYFDDLERGQVLDPAPAMTIGPGEAALYQSITGDPLRLVLSAVLAQQVSGRSGAIVNPALVMQVSIGQSTVATRRVIANLFYRGVRLQRTVRVGETLATSVEVRALKETSRRADRPPRGLALLGITTTTQTGEVVVDFERCAMLPLRGTAPTGCSDDVGKAEAELDLGTYISLVPKWNLAALREGDPEPWAVGEERADPMRDTVSHALGLVRLTQNQAMAHRDASLGQHGRRLVYGGHTIGLAQASLARLLPSMATVLGWHSCDHTGPVFENDLLDFQATLLAENWIEGGRVLAFAVLARARREGEDDAVAVLDWQPVVLAA